MAIKCALIIPDCHIPYENKRAYNLMLKVAKDLKPSEIVILGDYADFYWATSHGKHPDMLRTFKDEIKAINHRLDEMDELFPSSKKRYLCGNHEYRMERYLQEKAPELFGYVRYSELFELDKRPNWSWHAYGPNQRLQIMNSKLYARHEPLANTAGGTAHKAMCSLIYGHIHRIEESHIVSMDGKNHVCFSVGWLGDKRKEKIYGYVKNHHQWQLGFGLVYVDASTRYFYHEKIHILDNMTCVVNGKQYHG
jgi:hypothetical protein